MRLQFYGKKMDKIVVFISMLYLGSSLSAFAEQNISNEKVTLPGQMAEGQVDFLKEEKSAPVSQTFSLPTKSESEPTIISEPKNEEDEKQTSSVETFESDMPQITTDSKVSNPDSTLSSSTDVSDELKRGNELESLPSVETTPLIESSSLISDAVNNKTIAEPMPEVVAIEPKSEKIEEQAPLLGATDNSLNAESRIQEEANFPQLTAGHLDVLREIKDRANIQKEVITINDISREKLELTPTFKYIIYNSKAPDKNTIDPDKIVRIAVEEMLKTIQKKIQSLKKNDPSYTEGDRIYADMQNDFERVLSRATDLTLEAIRKEVVMVVDSDYEVFYHAHLPSLRLYYDMLSSIISYFKIQKIDYLKVIRDKQLTNEFIDIPTYLQTFNQQFEMYSHSKELPIFSDKDPKFLGFGSGPDHLLWAKINMISANLSLLGNRFKLGENTFYYFFNAFSHINSLDFLFESLLKKILINKTDAEIKARVKQYLNVFQRYMERGGGNLLQIFIKSTSVKKMTYFSWPYGIPVWLDHTRHLAVTNNSINSPLPMLWLPDESFVYETEQRRFMLPDPTVDLKLYRTNPEAYIEKYAPKGMKLDQKTKGQIYDRQQVRIVTNMALISDPNVMSIESYTRYTVPIALMNDYKSMLNKMIKNDMDYYLKNSEGDKDSPLGKLQKYIKQGTEYTQNIPSSIKSER